MANIPPNYRPRPQRSVHRPQRRWNGVSWWFSLLFVVGILAWGATLIFDIGKNDGSKSSAEAIFQVTVVDADTMEPIQGAAVSDGKAVATTDSSGIASLPYPNEPTMFTINAEGYVPIHGQSDAKTSQEQAVGLRRLSDAAQVQSDVSLVDSAPASIGSADNSAEPNGHGSDQESAQLSNETSGSVSGVVTDAEGSPIWLATVLVNGNFVETDELGTYTLDNVQAGDQVRIWASGYADQFLDAPSNGALDVSLSRHDIKAAYLTGPLLGDDATFDYLIDTINSTELNALVVVVKEGGVYYDTKVEFFRDAQAVTPLIDPEAIVQQLHENDIYAIARVVVFNDPVVAENRPDLAVKDDNGGTWRGYNGGAWVNPFNQKLWQPNIDIALELAGMGFDEIQYDYIRFPSDGDLSAADFGPDYDEESRVGAIVDFLKLTQEQLKPTGVKLAVDVFGVAAVFSDDQGIGQRIADFAPLVDYVCPMVYPSHFSEGFQGLPGDPNDLPYEIVELTVGLGQAKIPGLELKMRPWLQDFDWGDKVYGPEEVRAQIDAAMDQGSSGWMLWNPRSEVTEGALKSAFSRL